MSRAIPTPGSVPNPTSLNALELVNSYLGRAAAGGLIAGGGAAAYNATTEPEYYVDAKGRMILDAEGNPIIKATNDIDPAMAAAVGAGMGGASKYVTADAIPAVQQWYANRTM